MKALTIASLLAMPFCALVVPDHHIRAQSSPQSQRFSGGVTEAWVQNFVARLAIPSTDRAAAIAVDDSGNIYVTGRNSGSSGTDDDFATIKYAPDGTSRWVAVFTGSENSFNEPSAITIDDLNNVYVTGTGRSSATSDDYATVKYNAAGEQLWFARYDGPANGRDLAVALAVDDSGNVYVTGTSEENTFSKSDFITVKYDAAGVQQWIARYNGPGSNFFSRDEAAAVAVDDSGNVYVTGTSLGASGSDDYATVKYDAAGVEQWVARYDGPLNSDDEVATLALDDSGYVYVVGSSRGLSTADDFATIKYSAEGIEQWVVRYNGFGDKSEKAIDMEVDKSGNIYVAGTVSGDYVTVKYNPGGDQQWATKYSRLNRDNEAIDLAVDSTGNVFVTGVTQGSSSRKDYATVKYDADGNLQWIDIYNGPGADDDVAIALALDDAGNVYVTGTSFSADSWKDYATLKMATSGTRQWVARYDGPPRTEEAGSKASAFAIDDAGNVYVTGNSPGLAGSTDYNTVKYDATGAELWRARYTAVMHSFHSDYKPFIIVDGAGNVFVTGLSLGSETGFDYATIKFTTSGVEEWVARYNGPVNGDDIPADLAVDGAGNVYVTGDSQDSNRDFATVKYSPSGTEQWVVRYGATDDSFDEAAAIVIDQAGNAFVAGSSFADAKTVYIVIKYDSTGNEQWVATYEGPGGNDQVTTITIDDSGNVYVTGKSNASVTYPYNSDFVTIKYNAAGVQQWIARYDGPGSLDDEPTAIAIDNSGNVYVTGISDDSTSSKDYVTIKYDTAGVHQWIARYDGPGNKDDEAVALAVDGSGNVYVTGSSRPDAFNINYATLKYNSAGEQQWIARHSAAVAPAAAMPIAIAIYPATTGENLYVTGSSTEVRPGYGFRSTYTTIKYVQTTVAVEESESDVEHTYWLSQNYPNPFNPTTTIRYAIAKPGYVEIKVYNLAGQEVAALVSEKKPVGEHQVQWNPGHLASGVYVYRLQAGEFVETKKLLLMK